jgi:hypothetical protein
MRALALLLCALLTACIPQGVYQIVRPEETYTGIAVSSDRLMSAFHRLKVGSKVQVLTMRGKLPAVVVEIAGDVVLLEGDGEPLDLRPGDSGSAVVSAISARRPK